MLVSPELDPTVVAIAKVAFGVAATVVVSLGTWLGIRIVRVVRWWIGQEEFRAEVMGDPEKGKPSLRALGEQSLDAATKASRDVSGLYAILGLTPGAMQAAQAGAMRQAIRDHLSPTPPEPEPFANPDDTGRGRVRAHAVIPSPLPPPARALMIKASRSPSWNSKWGGKPPDDPDDPERSGE